jgi:hypothetical protein
MLLVSKNYNIGFVVCGFGFVVCGLGDNKLVNNNKNNKKLIIDYLKY